MSEMTKQNAREILEMLIGFDDETPNAGAFPTCIEFYNADLPDGIDVMRAIQVVLEASDE